jgi:hypothetical protein
VSLERDQGDDTSEVTAQSTIGGSVSRSEALARAQRWVDLQVPYSQDQSRAYSDGDGHAYRPDCSGFVSMVWHLPKKSDGWDFNTGDFGNYGGKTYISFDELNAGDAILGVSYGHIALFDRWTDGSRTTMWIYQENQPGTPANHVQRTRSWYVDNDFHPIRYNNMVDDRPGGTRHSIAVEDLNNDGKNDLIGRKASSDIWFTSNIGGGDGVTWGTGWLVADGSGYDAIAIGDLNNDGKNDLIGLKPNGDVWFTPNLGGGSGITWGTGWLVTGDTGYNAIAVGDLNNDGKNDLIGLKPNGDVWFSPNLGGGNGITWGAGWLIVGGSGY